jgi:hypothetical protein
MIMPATDEAIRGWFERYTEFVLLWAAIAEREGVDMLGIGSELKSLAATLPIGRWGNLKNYHAFRYYQKFTRERSLKFADEIEQRHLWVRGYDNYETLDAYVNARFEHNLAWAKQAYLRPESSTLKRINRRRALILDRWNALIDRTREVYGAWLTYGANFDNYRNVGFWPRLDAIGINAYFSLRANLSAPSDDAAFTKSWTGILKTIRSFKEAQGVRSTPVVFTELGYTFRRNATVEPWAGAGFSVVGWKGSGRELVVWGEQPVDLEERRRAVASLQRAERDVDIGLAGILYWKLSTDPSHREIEPFVLHVGPDSADPLQQTLVGFLPDPS